MACINPNNPAFQTLAKKLGSYMLAEVEFSKLQKEDFVIQNNGTFLNTSEEKRKEIFENYVNLMDRKREGKSIDFNKFNQMFDNLQVFKHKNTYIFGEWDGKNNVFKGRLMSSPGIKELYGALDVLFANTDFVASVPSDIGTMLERKGLYKLDVGKEYNFKGEEMVKNLYFSNKELVEKIFKTTPENVTTEQVKKYDEFFNYWSLINKLKKEYESKNFDNLLSILKEIGIYDYNAYKLVKKIKQGKITDADTETVIKEIIKNSANNKINIDKTDLINNPKIYEELNTELNKTLATYLSKFGIKTEVLEDMQNKLSIDSFAHIDILNKILYVDKNNQENYPQQAGKVVAYMMQHNPYMQEITSKMKKLSMFKKLNNDELFEAVGDLISEQLYKKTNTELPKDLIESIKNLIRQFFDFLNDIQMSRINKNIGFITDNILIQNQSLITQSVYKPGSVGKKVSKISLEEALKSDAFGNSIVEKMAKYFILTGSITLSEQGTVYRPNENQIHDLDWVSSLTREESIKIFNELYPNNKYIRNIYNPEYQTDTWLIAPEGYKIENLKIDNSKKVFQNGVKVGSTNKITGYDIVDSNGDVVSSYIPLSDSHTGKVEAKLIDIFSYEKVTEKKTANKEITLDSGTKLKIADWRNTFEAKLKFGRLKDIWDYNRYIPNDNITSLREEIITDLLSKKTEVEKILTEGDVQVKQLITKPIEEVKLDKIKKPEVIKKMKEILNILGITTEISNLPEEIAAQADILNRLIKFADDSITEDNFTEETIHFIVEILEQKNKPLFDKMMSEIWKYKIYTDVKNEYSSLKQYQNENGRPDYYKIKKEAIGQLLTAKLLDTQEVKDEKNFIGGIWEAISKFIKSLFTSISNQKRDAFQTTVDEILENPELIKQEDVQFLGQSSTFFSKKPSNKIASSLYKVKQKFGTASQTQFNKFNNNEEAWEYFKNLDSRIEKVTEKELNTQTNEYEDVEYYVFDGNKKQRVTTVIKEANNKTFANVSQDEQAQALREAKKQKRTEVHKTIEDILNRYIDPNTGEIRTTPLNRPLNLDIPKTAYDKLENHVQNRLATYPKGTKFLMETKVVNEEAGYAGTIDFLAFLPNGEVDILYWKTTDVSYWEAGIKRKRFDISPFNQTYWKTQLSFHKRALESHGIEDFRYTRAIPIALETKQTLIDKNKKYTPDNVIYQISNIEVGDSEPKKISKDLFYLTPVSVEDESTGIKELDELIDKLQGIYDRIQKTTYSKEEAYKKKQELDRLNLAIREIQTKRTATFFTNLFTENFERFEKLTDKEFEFLKDVKGKKFLSQEQEQELHNYLNEVYSAIEFLQAFQDFPGVIGELYKEGELTDYEKEVKKAAISIGGKAQTIGNQLIKNATSVIDQLGQLYNIDNTSGLDRKDTGLFTNFISILHREEKSIQFAARLLNAIKFLGNKEANEFFNEETGRYTVVYNGVQEWMKKNKKSLEDTYSLLLNKDKDGKPVRELLSKIKSEFFTELQNKQTEFTNYYKSQQELLSDLGYKGVKYTEELNKTYKKHVESWLSFNFNISEYEKSYKEALEKYKESNKNVRLDEDDLINEEKKRKRLESWIEEHDVFSSPKALSPRNYLLYPNLNESKWYSEGYKNLLKPENKPLLDAYNLFTELNKRAEDNGMLDDILNAKRFVPNVVDPSLSKSAFKMLKEGGLSPFYAISKIAEFFQKHLGFLKEVEPIDPQLDPLTKKQLRRIPVKYKYLQEGEEKDLSNDLFEIYAKWADHIIRYEMLSNYENRFKMVQLLESVKDKSFAVNNIGEIVRKKDKAGQKTKELDTIPKSKKIEEDLEKIINNYVYSSNLDVKPEFYKIANLLYDYTALNFLGINVTAWIASIVGASVSARLTEGKWFNKNDYLTIGISTTLGVFNKNIPKYGTNLYGKSKFLIKKLDTRILSEYDRDPSEKYTSSKIKLGDVAFAGFRFGDHFIQDALASSIFLNTTIIDGKFVNINDLVKSKYNSKIFDTKLSSQERAKLRKQRNKEIQELKEKSNLYRFIEEKNGKFSLKGIDLNSLEGQAQLISYQNKIASYIKQAVGNIDEWDKSINRMSWGMKFLMQFKNWMPRVFGARLQDIEYQYELDDYHYGRAKIAWDSFKLNTKDTLLEVIKNIQLLLPFVDKTITSDSIITLAKSQYLTKKSEALFKNKQFDLTEEQFVDVYTTGFNNALKELAILTQFALAVTFIGLAYSGSDDKDKWYWKILSRVIFKVNRELNSLYDPEQLIALGGKGAIPILGSLIQLYDLLGSYKDEIVGDIGQQLGIEGAEEKSKKAKPLSQTIKSTPFLRELHYWLSASSEEYADFMEIEQPEVQIE